MPYKVSEIMSKSVKSLKHNDRIADARTLMQNFNVSSVPVLDERDQIAGIVTKNDLMYRQPDAVHLSQLCQHKIHTIEPEADITQAIEIMKKNYIHHLLVTNDNNEPVGILSSFDVMDLIYKNLA